MSEAQLFLNIFLAAAFSLQSVLPIWGGGGQGKQTLKISRKEEAPVTHLYGTRINFFLCLKYFILRNDAGSLP